MRMGWAGAGELPLPSLVYSSVLHPIWRASVSTRNYLSPIFTLVFVVAISVLYPAIKAAVIKPVRAIHHR